MLVNSTRLINGQCLRTFAGSNPAHSVRLLIVDLTCAIGGAVGLAARVTGDGLKRALTLPPIPWQSPFPHRSSERPSFPRA